MRFCILKSLCFRTRPSGQYTGSCIKTLKTINLRLRHGLIKANFVFILSFYCFSRNKSALSSHPGYDEKIAHGDVTIAFSYAPRPVSMATTRSREASPAKMSAEDGGPNIANMKTMSMDDWNEPDSPSKRLIF